MKLAYNHVWVHLIIQFAIDKGCPTSLASIFFNCCFYWRYVVEMNWQLTINKFDNHWHNMLFWVWKKKIIILDFRVNTFDGYSKIDGVFGSIFLVVRYTIYLINYICFLLVNITVVSSFNQNKYYILIEHIEFILDTILYILKRSFDGVLK